MKIFKVILFITSLMLLFAVSGCKSEYTKQVGAYQKLPAANVIGEVLEISETGTNILVDSASDQIHGLIWVSIDSETDFFEDVDQEAALAYKDVSRDFEGGSYVELYVGGEVMESYPMQATATMVYVNESGEKESE